MNHQQIIWRRLKWWYLPIAIISLFFLNHQESELSINQTANSLQSEIEAKIDTFQSSVKAAPLTLNQNKSNYYAAIYKGDSLLTWNSNIYIPNLKDTKDTLINVGNSYYYFLCIKVNSKQLTYVVAVPLKETPLISNRNLQTKWILPYLQNDPIEFASESKKEQSNWTPVIIKGKTSFYIQKRNAEKQSDTNTNATNWAIVLITILSLAVFEISIFAFCKRKIGRAHV